MDKGPKTSPKVSISWRYQLIKAWNEQNNKAVIEEKNTDNFAAIKEEEENDDDGMSRNFTPSSALTRRVHLTEVEI